VVDGAWWGTIVSEPGSGGDSGLTRSRCVPEVLDGSVAISVAGRFEV